MTTADYVELHCHSNFSLLDGASHPEELVAAAAEQGMPALALTDHDALYAAVRFVRAAHDHAIRPILGAELTLADGSHLTLLVENEKGWHNLCYLISRGRQNAPKGEASLPPAELVGCTAGLIALSGCRKGQLAAALLRGDRKRAQAIARHYRELFGRDNFWIELQRHFLPGEELLIHRLAALADYLKLGCVATNNVHYAAQDRHRLQDVLVCIRHLATLDASVHLRRLNSEYCLKSAGQMAALFPDHPQAVANAGRLAERCQFEPTYGLQDLPHFPTPGGMSSSAYLRRLCEEALAPRYPQASAGVRQQMNYELDVIERAGLGNYFLIVWDLVRFAREQHIRCQGRGSAASSLVAYLLRISPIDPLSQGLVFERFLSDEQPNLPDIDLDFDATRREEVIQYMYDFYGRQHAAMSCTFSTFRSRSALRDIAKTLGLSAEVLSSALEKLEVSTPAETPAEPATEPIPVLLELSRQIEGFPRHLGIHSGGMVITGQPLMSRLPVEPAAMPNRIVVQWDKEELEAAGLVKIDILGLRILSAISDTLQIIERETGAAPDLDKLQFGDPAVYAMISAADTVGVFQVESRAQAQILPLLRPRCFDDLVIAISLIRPGPIQSNMVHPFLRRRLGVETVTYAHPLLEGVLAETLGVILFQEQVLKVARDLAGFTGGQGEQLRRALGKKRAEEEVERFHTAFLTGAEARGVGLETAEQVFQALKAFGGFSFAKSHAAAFAVLVYHSAWLKLYHYRAYMTALLNNQPMGFWNAAVLTNEAKRHGVQLLSVNLHHSQSVCAVEGEEIRLGFNYVKGLRDEQVARILAQREKGKFVVLLDFCLRTQLPRQMVENLIAAGAMDEWGASRRQLLWDLGNLRYKEDQLEMAMPPSEARLPPLTAADAIIMEMGVLGLSTREHIMNLYRTWMEERGIWDSRRLQAGRNGARAQVAGLVVVHQSPPTARGYHFVTLEDEAGMMNIVVRPNVYARYCRHLAAAPLWLVEGVVQHNSGVTNLLAIRAHSLSTIHS
ncbi:MAG: DNA polymerase III subunit alpha [Candidatus Promineifilaceae bacterium]